MSELKRLTKRQAAVIEDLFAGELAERAILEKHHVRPHEYERWLADEHFTARLDERIAHAHRQSRLILARSVSEAARKLIELTKCEKEETARKACLDIITLHMGPKPSESARAEPAATIPVPESLSPGMASRLLAVLARDEPQGEDDSQ